MFVVFGLATIDPYLGCVNTAQGSPVAQLVVRTRYKGQNRV